MFEIECTIRCPTRHQITSQYEVDAYDIGTAERIASAHLGQPVKLELNNGMQKLVAGDREVFVFENTSRDQKLYDFAPGQPETVYDMRMYDMDAATREYDMWLAECAEQERLHPTPRHEGWR